MRHGALSTLFERRLSADSPLSTSNKRPPSFGVSATGVLWTSRDSAASTLTEPPAKDNNERDPCPRSRNRLRNCLGPSRKYVSSVESFPRAFLTHDGAALPSEAIAGAVGAILTGALRPPPTGSLRSLVLAGTNLGEGGGVLLASALLGGSGDFEIEIDVDAPPPPPPPAAPALAALDVRGCGLGGAGMRGIAELLRRSTTLRVLALSGSQRCGLSGMLAVAEALGANTSLQELHWAARASRSAAAERLPAPAALLAETRFDPVAEEAAADAEAGASWVVGANGRVRWLRQLAASITTQRHLTFLDISHHQLGAPPPAAASDAAAAVARPRHVGGVRDGGSHRSRVPCDRSARDLV